MTNLNSLVITINLHKIQQWCSKNALKHHTKWDRHLRWKKFYSIKFRYNGICALKSTDSQCATGVRKMCQDMSTPIRRSRSSSTLISLPLSLLSPLLDAPELQNSSPRLILVLWGATEYCEVLASNRVSYFSKRTLLFRQWWKGGAECPCEKWMRHLWWRRENAFIWPCALEVHPHPKGRVGEVTVLF